MPWLRNIETKSNVSSYTLPVESLTSPILTTFLALPVQVTATLNIFIYPIYNSDQAI